MANSDSHSTQLRSIKGLIQLEGLIEGLRTTKVRVPSSAIGASYPREGWKTARGEWGKSAPLVR